LRILKNRRVNKFKTTKSLFNSFRTAHERMLVCRVLFCRPRTSACTFVTCTYIFTLANNFSDFFWIKSAREVSDYFLLHILNVWFVKFSWIFLLFWDWDGAQNKRHLTLKVQVSFLTVSISEVLLTILIKKMSFPVFFYKYKINFLRQKQLKQFIVELTKQPSIVQHFHQTELKSDHKYFFNNFLCDTTYFSQNLHWGRNRLCMN
jgi:hypothetical protein